MHIVPTLAKNSNLKKPPVILNINNVENADTASKVETKTPDNNHKDENNKKVENPMDDPDGIDAADDWVEK